MELYSIGHRKHKIRIHGRKDLPPISVIRANTEGCVRVRCRKPKSLYVSSRRRFNTGN